uniref:Uncharacterized protein n=1 Tax=Lotus japonicus TaxID=34305 RepID=I3SX25_LOTJA|nr:unknown [Lotus japonicus]
MQEHRLCLGEGKVVRCMMLKGKNI